ncbi:MAG: hypothetical protein JXA25_16730 [Anaerolineales bacterium]|nr:hypothetical protein [Anaerolineales bacterium]
MKKISLLLILPILLLTSLACSVPVSLYEFFGRSADTEAGQLGMAADEEDFAMEVVPDPTDSPEEASSAGYEPTLAEKSNQGLHSYRMEGTTNLTSDGVLGGQVQAAHFFDPGGVRYHYVDSAPEAFYERVSENNYEKITDNGTRQILRYFEGGFTWSSLNPEGGEMDLTFWLED